MKKDGNSCVERGKVLIDTWWNVNKGTDLDQYGDEDGFNRYMVECEYICGCRWGC